MGPTLVDPCPAGDPGGWTPLHHLQSSKHGPFGFFGTKTLKMVITLTIFTSKNGPWFHLNHLKIVARIHEIRDPLDIAHPPYAFDGRFQAFVLRAVDVQREPVDPNAFWGNDGKVAETRFGNQLESVGETGKIKSTCPLQERAIRKS